MNNPLKQTTPGMGDLQQLLGLPRYVKRALLMFMDFSLMLAALWAAYSLRLWIFYWPDGASLMLLQLAAPVIGVVCFHYNGLYKLITRFSGNLGALKVVVSVCIAVLIWCLLIYMTQFTLSHVPRSVIVMYGLFSIILCWGARVFVSHLLRNLLPHGARRFKPGAVPVVIYGVNEVGNQLAQELVHSNEYRLVGFLDDSSSLWRQMLFGVRVHNPANILKLIEQHHVREIFLADQTMPRRKRRDLLNTLAPLAVELKALSPMHRGAISGALVAELRQIGLEDLLGRDPVPPDQALLEKTVKGMSVMITGAGGSIGSELARQVFVLGPQRLVLYERSELALYQIEQELADLGQERQQRGEPVVELKAVLGCVNDGATMESTIETFEINTLYHAAAYKHVPIVEENPFAGLENNVFGTLTAARAAINGGVDLFVLISTDKAVRPTNVMGASKRIAELCLQALADESSGTTLTMVRFGNVLGSSGSVVGRFQRQIEKGGPVTVTHPDIMRYFMMIPEAAQLVIQAGGLARGGDVFVLDMGKPVKIVDLARSMINLSGLEVMDDHNPEGDIAVEFVGLREGEKLYEELLIEETSTKTSHPSIIRNHESHIPLTALNTQLEALQKAIDQRERQAVEQLLLSLVEGYHREGGAQPGAGKLAKIEPSCDDGAISEGDENSSRLHVN